MRLFRRKPRPPTPISEAELARRLTADGYRCACCGEVLDAPHAIRLRAPFGWPDPPAPEPDEAFDTTPATQDIITERFARRGRDLLVRAQLPVPVKGTEGHVFLGVWAHLSTGDFARFRPAQARGEADRLGDLSSWLYSRIPAASGPVITKGILVPVEAGGMPVYWITDEKHPLHSAQHEGGMSAEDVAALYADLGADELLVHLKA